MACDGVDLNADQRPERLHPIAAEFEATPDGLYLRWPRHHPEARLVGSPIGWSRLRGGDPDAFSPELYLDDDTVVFVSALCHDKLRMTLQQHRIPMITRRPVWSLLLDPFLDTDYEIVRERCESRLRECGFDDDEMRAIRARVAPYADRYVQLTWEWQDLGEADLIAGYLIDAPDLHAYGKFRRWADHIAARGEMSS
ncbi:hypothetical protein AAFP30_16590 [Gordonia sp. CPCC 205515]|uniref:hypothetical protein n=1 Tax=Gordonia sp. CPCC 205515 TaxID=3140791 RepID=UPI003AF3879B